MKPPITLTRNVEGETMVRLHQVGRSNIFSVYGLSSDKWHGADNVVSCCFEFGTGVVLDFAASRDVSMRTDCKVNDGDVHASCHISRACFAT
jgi:hypothetical protein